MRLPEVQKWNLLPWRLFTMIAWPQFMPPSPRFRTPLRLNDEKAWRNSGINPVEEADSPAGISTQFQSAGSRCGGTWKDLQNFTNDISDLVFISRNLKALRKRELDMLFIQAPMILLPLTWHGVANIIQPYPFIWSQYWARETRASKNWKRPQNKAAFMLKHFPKNGGALLEPPNVESKVKTKLWKSRLLFQTTQWKRAVESGGSSTGSDGSPNYISQMIRWPDLEMKKTGESWTATIPLSPTARRIDFSATTQNYQLS